jgi:hypothetical protein
MDGVRTCGDGLAVGDVLSVMHTTATNKRVVMVQKVRKGTRCEVESENNR